jgi:hypothetical protein
VAELEATTARKGNRKMSLTITGQVHRMVLDRRLRRVCARGQGSDTMG